MTWHRVYFRCRRCGLYAYALDERLGVTGFVRPHARRLLCLAGVDRASERAARPLRDPAGLVVCDNTVRAACDRHGTRARARQRGDPEADRGSRAAAGAIGFQTDGTCGNTTHGRREVRLSVFAERGRGRPVLDLEGRDEQRLPAPAARVASAVIRTSAASGPQWRRAAARLGMTRTDQITVRADGAQWIWKEVAGAMPGAEGVLDFYHASGAYRRRGARPPRPGPGTSTRLGGAARAGVAGVRRRGGAGGVGAGTSRRHRVDHVPGAAPGPHGVSRAPARRPRDRQRDGGGGCKTAIGLRLKQAGARWKVRRIEHMAAPCCLRYGELGDAYWKKTAG